MKVTFKNRAVNYQVSGNHSGPVIVWLHGFMENKAIWKHQVAHFNADYKNICIDLLGHGFTENVSEIHSMELQAETVIAVLEKLKITNFFVVGHSMGGYVALALLQKIPVQIKGIVLLNSTSRRDSEEKKNNRDRAVKLVHQNKSAFLRMSLVNLFSENSKEIYAQEIEGLLETLKDISPEGIIAALLGMKIRLDRSEILKKYNGKKMIIAGVDDTIIPFLDAENEAKNTKTEFVVLKSGHMSYLECTEDTNDSIASFLN